MRVCYAAQLLSKSVSKLMKKRGGEKMERSAWLANLMNKWFDLMNTRLNYGYNKDLIPYKDVHDPRLMWLSDTFINELDNWKGSTKGKNELEKEKQFLSKQTYAGLVMASKAMSELVKYLLSASPPGSYVCTRRINQDPLEAFFGQVRRTGGSNEAPDVNSYGQYQNIISCMKQYKQVKGSNVEIVD